MSSYFARDRAIAPAMKIARMGVLIPFVALAMAFENAHPFPNRTLSVQLRGRAGNSTCIGGRVTVTLTDGSKQSTEIYAGGGYLSQSTSVPSFGLGGTNSVANITVRWPDGTVTSAVPSSDSSTITMRQP